MGIAFSIPNIPSLTSTTPNQTPILFVPNVRYIRKFIEGDLGIAKKIVEKFNSRSLSEIKDKDTLNAYLKISGVKLGRSNINSYFSNGKFIPPTKISVEKNSNNLGGLDALEKALITSIFETQKPYIEIAKLVIDHFVIIEDIVAHVLGLLGRSKKPRGNPRALGYQGSQDGGGVSKGMAALDALKNKPGPKNSLSNPNSGLGMDKLLNTPLGNTLSIPFLPPFTYITQSILYSTGEFKEGIDYQYIYKDYFEEFNPIIGTVSTAIEDEDETGKDEVLVLGVYDSNWEPLVSGNQKIQRYLDWISPKYQNNLWPQLKPDADFDFVYVGIFASIEAYINVGGPGTPTDIAGVPVNWQKKVYKEDDGPFLEVEGERKAIKEGQQMIALNSNKTISTLDFYKQFYLEYTEQKIDKSIGDGPSTYVDENGNTIDLKQETLNNINTMLSDYGPTGNLVIQLEGLISNNFLTLSGNNSGGPYTTNLQDGDKFNKIAYAFKPKKNLANIWVDPETEYDMKIIKCDSTINIKFEDVVGEPEKTAVIRRFIDKNLTINVTNNQSIGIIIPKGGTNKIYANLQSLNIDFYSIEGSPKFAPIELAEIFDATPTNNLPIQIFQESVPPPFLQWWVAGTFISQGKILNGVQYRWEPFANSGLNSGLISNYQDKYYLSSRYLTASSTYDSRRSKITDTPLQSQKQEFSGANLFPGLTGELWKIEFNGNQIYVDKTPLGYLIFLGAIKSNVLIFEIPENNIIKTINYDPTTNTTSLVSQVNVPNQIRIEDTSTGTAKSRIISNSQVTNNQLRITGPLSQQPYGTPNVTAEPGESATQTVDQIYRYQRYEDDVETFYIIEAVLKSKNKNPLLSDNGIAEKQQQGANSSGGGGGSYTWKNIFGVIPKFIRLVIRLATKLFPVIQAFLNLIRNPAQFITDIIIAKLGDDFGTDVPKFGFFSKEFIDQLKQVKTYAQRVKASQGNLLNLQEAKNDLERFLSTSLLKNYVFIDNVGRGKFVLDGSATIRLFGDAPLLKKLPGITFGIETNLGSLISPQPKAPFKLIFSLDRFSSSTQKQLADFLGITNDNVARQLASSTLANANLNPSGPLVVKNQIVTEVGGVQTIEEVSIQYSTGVFKEGVNYQYIYLYEEVIRTLEEANQLESQGDDESISKAIRLLEEAARIDSNNKLIKEKLGNLRRLQSNFSTQPIFDFMLNLVSLPVKVIIGIIMYILNFFKSLTNPFQLPSKIIQFLTFTWLIDFFNPTSPNSMFAMADILFDIKKFFTEWLPGLTSGTKTTFDMSEIIKLPWMTFPTFKLEELKSMLFGSGLPGGVSVKFPIPIPVLILSSILCLIEAIINSFIDFIWSIFGLVDPESGKWIVIKPPYLKLCKDTNKSISPKDILKLLNLSIPDMGSGKTGSGIAKNPSVTDDDQSDESSFNFIYDIKTSDGRSIMDLDDVELKDFMEKNKDIQYTFNF